MSDYARPRNVKIVYFSGTGGTAIAAEKLTAALVNNGISVVKKEIDIRVKPENSKEEMLILLYPVYACNAPKPVYDFINSFPEVNNIPAVVISVSAGGDITPNTACRLHCIKRLEKKGYRVVYEKMLVMPSNFITSTPEKLAICLLEILPGKINKITGDLISEVVCKEQPSLLNRFFSSLGELEKSKFGSIWFGKRIRHSKNCTGCGLCAKSCPTGNIIIKNSAPAFAGKCTMCLRCIYNCPQKALTPGIGKFIVVKEGYNLRRFENRVSGLDTESIKNLAKGYALSGIRKYLLEE